MNWQDAVFSLFPGCTVMTTRPDDGVIEVSGIGAWTVPQNCEVLARGMFHYAPGERERWLYLVRAQDLLWNVRIFPQACGDSACAHIVLKSPAAVARQH